jgi:hypothetical protein
MVNFDSNFMVNRTLSSQGARRVAQNAALIDPAAPGDYIAAHGHS